MVIGKSVGRLFRFNLHRIETLLLESKPSIQDIGDKDFFANARPCRKAVAAVPLAVQLDCLFSRAFEQGN